MSLVTSVTLDAAGVDAHALLAALQAGVPAIRAVEERYNALWLLGPGGFSLTIDPGRVSLYHITRFSLFTHDAEAQVLLADACQALASLMGASSPPSRR